MKMEKSVLAVFVAVGMLSQMAFGGVIWIEDGSTGTTFDDWTLTDEFGGLANGAFLQNDGSLGGNPIPSMRIDEISGITPGTDRLFENIDMAGDWGDGSMGGTGDGIVRRMSFDFYGDATVPPVDLEAFFYSGVSGDEWHYAFTPTTGWGSYEITTAFGGGWFNTAGPTTLGAWDAAFADVTEVGLYVGYAPNSTVIYGIDNFALDDEFSDAVPEPQTYAMLGFALCSVGMTFRRKLDGVMGTLKSMIKA